MDPTFAAPSAIDNIAEFLTGGVVATVAGLSAAAFGVGLHSLRRRALWHRVGAELGLSQQTAASPVALGSLGSLGALPALSGIYRGRAIEATLLSSGQTRISVRTTNPRRLLDEIRADDAAALTSALWLTARQRTDVAALRGRLPRAIGSIAVRGNFVTLTAPTASVGKGRAKGADNLRALLALAHGIAESVDAASGAFIATPARGRRRCGPGTLLAQRRG